jgi:hypothetical protein
MSVSWDDGVDAVLGGDLTAALGYRTPAGGVVVQAIAPIGLRDRAAGTVGFTTSLGFSKKLERIARDPRVALAFHAREHGTAEGTAYVLVQGLAHVIAEPSPEQRDLVRRQASAHLGPPREGRFWDRWLHEYYSARVPVEIRVQRIVSWPDLRCQGPPAVTGEPVDGGAAPAQRAPRNGIGPRVDVARAARRLSATTHTLLGFAGIDGFPVVVPVQIEQARPDALLLRASLSLPTGGRRAGLLGHSYRPQLIGLETRQYTGWLHVKDGEVLYAPHTETGYRAPPNKTLLLLLNGLLAKRGVRRAARANSPR